MSKTTKIVLGIVGIVVVLCLCLTSVGVVAGVWGISRTVTLNPQKVQAAADEIMSYDMPPGYHNLFVMNLGIMKVLSITAISKSPGMPTPPMIGITQVVMNAQLDPVRMRQVLLDSVNRNMRKNNVTLKLVKQEIIDLRGAPTEVFTFEGINDQGIQYRAVGTAYFPARNGVASVLISGETAAWDEQAMDNFIRSIR